VADELFWAPQLALEVVPPFGVSEHATPAIWRGARFTA
jgi:hypothetical protein